METAYLLIDGIDRLERVNLKKHLEKEQVEYKDLPNSEAVNETGKAFEFISTGIVVLGVTNIALSAFRLWWENRKQPGEKKPIKVSIKLPNNTMIIFGDDGEIESVLLNDGTLIEVTGEPDSDEKISQNINAFSDLVKTIQDFLKDIIQI